MVQDPVNAIAAFSQQEPAQASAQVAPEVSLEVSPEDQVRAGLYGLLAALLRDVPGEALLARTRALDPARGRDGFALAWEGLRLAAAQVTAAEADDEYHRLFIGLGRGELVPYGSWYLTGFLMELPLGELRRDLKALGFERQPGVHEPEDHVAALCEVMSQLALDPEVPLERQLAFYRAHVGPWIHRFCGDLESVPGAPLYGAVGRLASAFFGLEGRYLEMES
jgi:TorA maturation chaperone TorD